MVTITNYSERTRKDGTTFIALELTGGVELVQSNNTGKFYATVRKTSIPSTFDESIAKGLIGTQMKGDVVRVQVDPYEFTDKDESFCGDANGNINLCRLYNLFTGASKSSYIDNFLDRSVNAFNLVEQILFGLENKTDCWYLN
jgi:hypothetical protein